MKPTRSSAPFVALACALISLAAGCLNRGLATTPSVSVSEATEPSANTSTRQRIVHITMQIIVPDLASGTRALRAAIDAQAGTISAATEERRSAVFEAHVPTENLAATRTALDALGETVEVTEESTDVTVQHRDLSAQLVSVRAEEARLLALMNTSTTNLADVLAVERELTRVSTSIAQLEANERDLSSQIAMARLSITLVPASPGFAEDPLAAIADAASSGLTAARNLAVGSVIVLAAMAPTLALFAALLFVMWRVLKALRSRFATR